MLRFPRRTLGADSSGRCVVLPAAPRVPKFEINDQGRATFKFDQSFFGCPDKHFRNQRRRFKNERVGFWLENSRGVTTTMPSSNASTLSILSSDDFAEDFGQTSDDEAMAEDAVAMPPAKRQRTNPASELRASTSQHNFGSEHVEQHDEGTDISSDTSGDVPNSPTNGTFQSQDDDPILHEQVTVCRWENCEAGDLGDMDQLVAHIHDIHVGTRQKKYACEWLGCPRKAQLHASGYALKAHMRSHTREKPFYCLLPGESIKTSLKAELIEYFSCSECDRSFTRSDALAKHMRTVHETEALRPSDPVSKNHSSAPAKVQRIKLTLSAKPPKEEQRNGGEEIIDDDATLPSSPDMSMDDGPLSDFEPPSDVEFTEEELAMPIDKLAKLLRRQVHWGEQEGVELKAEVEKLESERRKEWESKELLLENVIEAEGARARKRERKKGSEPVPGGDEFEALVLPMTKGPIPWYRKSKEEPNA
ncbi:MAG: hypothetical protein M1812_001763 [Candelaria pacifica]|nr:MAG: hypothetical protein M1812_001763 [Candelaria pacifica]